MAELFREAMSQFKTEIRTAITDVPVDQADLDDFIELFATDFAEILANDDGPAIWRRDGRRVRRLGRYLGTLAEFFAVARVLDETVTRKHLMRALRIMQPECKLRAKHPSGERKDFCQNVQIDDFIDS